MRLVEINKRLYAAGLKWYQIPPQKKVTLATLRASIRKEAESMGDNEASDMAALRPRQYGFGMAGTVDAYKKAVPLAGGVVRPGVNFLGVFRLRDTQGESFWWVIAVRQGLISSLADCICSTREEADKAVLAKQQRYLNGILAQKKAVSANYDAEIAEAKNRAAQYKQQIAADTKKIEQLKEEERRRLAAQNAQNGAGSKNVTSNPNAANTIAAAQAIVAQSGGSSAGKSIANYACQCIGNPYVSGGTSLTNGADCSGFIFRLYADYGYRVPRTSSQLRSVGTGVSYAEAQPGDIICYEGHVGMYIGGGMIVHASTQRTGIKVSNAQYRPILAVRRVL